MPKGKKSAARRFAGRVRKHVRHGAAKPSIAITVGALAGPLEVATGNSPFMAGGNLWQLPGGKLNELWTRLSITYFGYNPSSRVFAVEQARGTIFLIGGTVLHGIANLLGLNRYLARMKFPVRL